MNKITSEKLEGAAVGAPDDVTSADGPATVEARPRSLRRIALMLFVPLLLLAGGAYYWISGAGTV